MDRPALEDIDFGRITSLEHGLANLRTYNMKMNGIHSELKEEEHFWIDTICEKLQTNQNGSIEEAPEKKKKN